VFKEIYHLEVRKSARSTVPESLVLVTVVPMYSSQPDKNHSHMKDSMLILERALRKCLRVGDVAAKRQTNYQNYKSNYFLNHIFSPFFYQSQNCCSS